MTGAPQRLGPRLLRRYGRAEGRRLSKKDLATVSISSYGVKTPLLGNAYYDGTAARNIDREQAARLAAILPAPLKRRPARMNQYSALILLRMRQMGW